MNREQWADWSQKEAKRIYDKYGGADFFGGPPPGTREHTEWRAGREHVRKLSEESGISRTPKKKVKSIVADKGKYVATSFPKKKMPKGTTLAQKKLVTRSSMVVSGKTKVKRTRRIKVPGRLRKQIKQVIAGNSGRGTYVTIKSGFVGNVVTTAANPVFTAGDDLNKTLCGLAFNSQNNLAGRSLFNQLASWRPGVSTALIANTGMNYFTPLKIIDAASVLFNKKQPTGNPYVSLADNLSTLATSATGAPGASPGQLKIDVQSSWAKFTMKNVGNRVATVEIWECTPILKFQGVNPLQDMITQIESLSQITSDTNFRYITNATDSQRVFFDATQDPFYIAKKHMGLKWSWKKRTMIMAPEETCTHSITGPKGVLDFTKILNVLSNAGGTAAIPETQWNVLMKNWSVGVVIGVSGDYVLPTANSSGGRFVFSGVDGGLSSPIAVEVQEGYRIVVPEVAGFIQTDLGAGTVQQLNLRKHKTIVFNQQGIGNAPYSLSNEVNPAAEMAFSQSN